jgi:predicted esterase
MNGLVNSVLSHVPVIFMHGEQDNLIPMTHMHQLYNLYSGDKVYIEVPGGHNSRRPRWLYERMHEYITEKFLTVRENGEIPIEVEL